MELSKSHVRSDSEDYSQFKIAKNKTDHLYNIILNDLHSENANHSADFYTCLKI